MCFLKFKTTWLCNMVFNLIIMLVLALLSFLGNDALDKAVKSNEEKESFQRYPQATGRLVSFTRKFLRNIQNEIEKNQRGQR